uniref:Golgi apparatus membrane protein TVP23 homolog n=1 Tax=Fopius arisanus TaxID=64838 RepID=A0A0C9PY02_9HYME
MCPLFQGSQQNRINASESRIFWLALILCPLLWALFFIIALFGLKFKWLLLVCIAIVLNGANLYGYVKCKMGKEQSMSAATSDFLKKQVMQNVMASMMTKSPPTTTAGGQQPNII